MKLLLQITLFLIATQLFGQAKITTKLYAKDLKLANAAFEMEDYLEAITLYKKVLAVDPNHETANLNSVISKIKINQPADSCVVHLMKLKTSTKPEVQFYFGKIYHLTSNFEEAIRCYEKYKTFPVKKRTIPDTEVNYYISCSKSAIELISHPHLSVIKNIGNTINSPYADYVPLISPDETTLYFTSRREGSTGNLKDVYGNYFEDVYVSQKGDDGKWATPKNIGAPINTSTHDACVALSFDGNQLIIYRTAADMISGDLYLSRMDFDGWAAPVKFGPLINTPYIETSACFSTDTSVIYFSSNKIGGLGGKDIYRIKKLPDGRWSNPMNLGPTINTDKDEDSPFLHPDGTTLYFSSKGHNTMGDYDVFKSILNTGDNTFFSPENLGFPINTINNDIFFVLNAKGTRGYYSSIKEETFGSSDIYTIDMRFGDNDVKVKQGKVVFGNESRKAKITLIDIESKQVSGIFNANSKTGKFILVMNPLKAYKAIVEEDGFQTMIVDIEPMVNELLEKELILSLSKKK